MSRAILTGKSGEFVNMQFPIGGGLRIGRDARACQVVFSSGAAGISGTHCQLQQQPDGLYLTDLNSTNGTFLDNGTRLSPNVGVRLAPGQGFYLGDPSNSFYVREEVEIPQAAPSISPNPVPQMDAAPMIPPEYEPLSMWLYLGYSLLFAVPGIGLIFALLFSFGTTNNINLCNYARSFLIKFALAIAMVIVWFFMVGSFIGGIGKGML